MAHSNIDRNSSNPHQTVNTQDKHPADTLLADKQTNKHPLYYVGPSINIPIKYYIAISVAILFIFAVTFQSGCCHTAICAVQSIATKCLWFHTCATRMYLYGCNSPDAQITAHHNWISHPGTPFLGSVEPTWLLTQTWHYRKTHSHLQPEPGFCCMLRFNATSNPSECVVYLTIYSRV